jgi:hypothetical protein
VLKFVVVRKLRNPFRLKAGSDFHRRKTPIANSSKKTPEPTPVVPRRNHLSPAGCSVETARGRSGVRSLIAATTRQIRPSPAGLSCSLSKFS